MPQVVETIWNGRQSIVAVLAIFCFIVITAPVPIGQSIAIARTYSASRSLSNVPYLPKVPAHRRAGRVPSWISSTGSSPTCTAWNLAADFRTSPNHANPNPDSCGNKDVWYFMQSSGLAHDSATYSVFNSFNSASNDRYFWQSNNAPYHWPYVAKNSAATAFSDGYSVSWPAGSVIALPNTGQLVVIGWRSPFTGNVSIKGSVTNVGYGCGDGLDWSIEHDGAKLANGGWDKQTKPLAIHSPFTVANVTITQGSFIYLVVDPRQSNYCDEVGWDVTINSTSGPSPTPSPSSQTISSSSE